MKRPQPDPVREDRIYNEAIVDARPEEQAMSWYYYLEGKITFPFRARCVGANAISPLRKGETVEVLRMAVDDACEHDMLMQIRWQGRKMAVSLSQLEAINPDESTQEAIGDWQLLAGAGLLSLIYARLPKAHDANLEIGIRRMYRAALELHVKPFFGHLVPQKLSSEMLREYREKRSRERAQKYSKASSFRLEKRVSQTTINRELASLRGSLHYALKTNRKLHFTVPYFPMHKEKNIRIGFLREEKFRQLYEALPYAGARALAAASFYTGVRKGELTKVNWDQVDFEVGVIALYETKNHETRAVPIVPGLMEDALREA